MEILKGEGRRVDSRLKKTAMSVLKALVGIIALLAMLLLFFYFHPPIRMD